MRAFSRQRAAASRFLDLQRPLSTRTLLLYRAGTIRDLQFGSHLALALSVLRITCSVAWVTYSSPAEATRALSLEGQDFGGRPLKAELSNRGEKKPREARERKPRAAKGEWFSKEERARC